MGLRDRKNQAKQTSQATKKIGLIAKIVIQAGVAPFGRGITNAIKAECFRAYSEKPEAETRKTVQEATEKAVQHLPISVFQVGPVLNIQVVKDTSLTPTSRWQGNMYSMKDYDASDRFTHKRHADFILDHMSDEINDLEGKEFWAHVAWKTLPQGDQYGGDYSQIGESNNDELCIIITYLPNKRAATELAKSLREGTTRTDDLCLARGYDVNGIREGIRAALGGARKSDSGSGVLSDIGNKTKTYYKTMEKFVQSTEFFAKNLEQADGDIDAMANKCLADPGDVAVVLNKPEYFRTKMEATGLGEQEALVEVAKATGLANPADLASFLGIPEPAF